ncbi:glycoside hydrolase family 2 protein [Chitinophagaceae bacterium MMS25-I14]
MFIAAAGNGQQSYDLANGWKYKSAGTVKENGKDITAASYSFSNWAPAIVPGTVLANLIHSGLAPDPFYGLNNAQIPDIYYTGREKYTYWFANEFKERPTAGTEVFLCLRGVNYSFDIFLNGHQLNDQPEKGMYLRHRYRITPWLSQTGNNKLAVIVHPPDPVGFPNGGQGGDGVIARNLCNQYVAGWDWIPSIADRNTGIWDKVTIEKTGVVSITDPHVITEVPGKRTVTGPQPPAIIKAFATLENVSDKPVKGSLHFTIGSAISDKYITLPPHSKKEVEAVSMLLPDPKLWWPNGYGPQNLYKAGFSFIQDGEVAPGPIVVMDEKNVTVGIRQLTTIWNEHTQSRELLVNGQKIFIKGGNWILTDALLRFTPEKYDAEIRFHRDMNLNLIRVWGGGILERPEFFDACDRYGLLVFQDFWVSGDCNGRWYDTLKKEDTLTRRQYPDDHQLFLTAAADQIKMVRNHPSLAYWCGGNEIKPPADILIPLRDSLLPTLDGTRYFFNYSNDDSMSLNSHDGPYYIQKDTFFWQHRSWPFNSEIGSIGMSDLTSLQRFIPAAHLKVPQYANGKDNIDTVWRYHKYTGYDSSVYAYGPVKNIKDFADKAQLVNYNQYRALIEGASARMWDWYTGIIIWKTQNPWTALRGQMYDYYLDPNACLYGLHNASEPVHIMFNPLDSSIMVVNNTFNEIDPLYAKAVLYRCDGTRIVKDIQQGFTGAQSTTRVQSMRTVLQHASDNNGLFLVLTLMNNQDSTLSENTYWLANDKGEYPGIAAMKPQPAMVSAEEKNGQVIVTLTNTTNAISFFNRISLTDIKEKKRILPVFYSDNYITLMPGAQKTVTLDYKNINAAAMQVSVEVYNGPVQYCNIKK